MKRNRPSLFERLKSGMDDLLLYAKDEKQLVETRRSIPDPPRAYSAADVVAVRVKLGLSQSGLAALMHVSIKTVQSWEQGLRAPSGVASRLLQMLEEPGPFLKALHRKPASRGRGSIAG
ncbi:helix-turn-helix domain-containing protein [bacterium]|nr:helix-turn-helix domain-containing protein [bacterium]